MYPDLSPLVIAAGVAMGGVIGIILATILWAVSFFVVIPTWIIIAVVAVCAAVGGWIVGTKTG